MRPWQAFTLVAVFWAGIYLPGLGSTELKGEEARRILPARTMLQSGDWVVPRVAGLPYSRKPPLINWAIAGSFSAAGVQNEWTARLPSVLAVLALALALVAFGVGIRGVREGFLAALFVLTSFGMVDKGRLAEIEALYVAIFGLALLAWLTFFLREKPLAMWCSAAVFLGLGLLAKGPVHLLLFYLIAFGVLRRSRECKLLLHPGHFLGIALMAAIVWPWGYLNQSMNPSGDSGNVWADQVLSRLQPSGIDLGNWLLVPLQSVGNFLPWALFLPLLWRKGALSDIEEQRGDRAQSMFAGVRWGMALGFLILALIPGSRARFSMPLIVPASLLTAMAVVYLRGTSRARVLRVWKLVCFGAAALAMASAAAIPFLGPEVGGLAKAAAMGILLVGGGLICCFLRNPSRSSHTAALAGWSGALAVMMASVYALAVVPLLIPHDNVRSFAGDILEAMDDNSSLIVLKASYQPFVFYLGETAREVAVFADLPPKADYVLVKESQWADGVESRLTERYGPVTWQTLVANPRESAGGGQNRYLLARFASGAATRPAEGP